MFCDTIIHTFSYKSATKRKTKQGAQSGYREVQAEYCAVVGEDLVILGSIEPLRVNKCGHRYATSQTIYYN
jgi:hypothetical protein